MKPTNCNAFIRIHRALLVGLLAAGAIAATVDQARAYEHRRNTPSIGGQIQYGYMLGDSPWANRVNWGIGVSINLRQYIARSRAIGITFEQQKFDRISSLGVGDGSPVYKPENADHVQFQILMLDYFFYFNRMRKETSYLVLSAGGYRPQELFDFQDVNTGTTGADASYPPEGFIARLGLGFEYFASRSLAIDASVSGYFVNATQFDQGTYTVQAAIGIMLYPGR